VNDRSLIKDQRFMILDVSILFCLDIKNCIWAFSELSIWGLD